MNISLMLNIVLRFLFIKTTDQLKSLWRIKKNKSLCIEKSIFNFPAPELIVY